MNNAWTARSVRFLGWMWFFGWVGRVLCPPHGGADRPSGLSLQHQPAPPAQPPVQGTLWVVGPGEWAGQARKSRMAFPHRRQLESASLTNSAARAPIMIEGALVLPETSRGMIEASATHSPSTLRAFSLGSTTLAASPPIRQVPTG